MARAIDVGTRVRFVATLFAGSMLCASPALAVLTSDNTNIGAHPAYGSVYSAFWRTGLDYSVLTSPTKTYINAPSAGGSLLFRTANWGAVPGDPDGSNSNMWLDSQGTVTAGSLHLKGPIPTGTGLGYTATIEGSLFASTIVTSSSVASGYGILGFSTASSGRGVYGVASGTNGIGVQGTFTGAGIAVRGDNTDPSGWAGYFNGRAFTTLGAWSSSDIRLKKDIKSLPYGLNEVLRMRPVTYFWKSDTEAKDKQVGLIAQEMKQIVPEVVTLDQTTGMYSINYPSLVPVLIKAVQDLQITIKDQQKQIASLQHGSVPSRTTSLLSSPAAVGGSIAILPLGLLVASRFRGRREGRKATPPDA